MHRESTSVQAELEVMKLITETAKEYERYLEINQVCIIAASVDPIKANNPTFVIHDLSTPLDIRLNPQI